MSELFETDEYVINDNPYTDPGGGGGGGTDLDSLDLSTNESSDDDLFVTKEDGGTAWVKKSFLKIWNYIKSKIKSVLHVDTGTIDDIVNVYGAKNLIPYPYYHNSGRESRGITFTYDADGVFTLNGTPDTSSQPFFNLAYGSNTQNLLKAGEEYILSCEHSVASIFAIIYFKDASGTNTNVTIDAEYEDGTTISGGSQNYISLWKSKAHNWVKFKFTSSSVVQFQIDIRVHEGSAAITNATAKVMLRLASIQDDTYVPYAKTNRELTAVVSKTANGLAPQLPNETTTTKYLRQDGTWQVPPDNNTTKGNGITTYAAKTGSGTTVTRTIAANTTMDNAIGTLLNNDSALNSALNGKIDSSTMTLTNINQINFSRGGDIAYIEWVNQNIRYNVGFHPTDGIIFNRYNGSEWVRIWNIPIS